jgi:hypothetical protein
MPNQWRTQLLPLFVVLLAFEADGAAAGVDDVAGADGAAAGFSVDFAASFDSAGFDSAEDSAVFSELVEA